MYSAGDNEELKCFRREWMQELSKTKQDKEVHKGNLEKCQNFKQGDIERAFVDFKEEVRHFHPVGCSTDKSCSVKFPKTTEEKSSVNVNDDIVLLNLPQPQTGEVNNDTPSDSKVQQKLFSEKLDKRKKSLLDQLIEDIDEITSIPFFDLSLPKEVGLQIFTDLGIKDLCACAQVSKAWKILAEDELIWYHVGCKLGYVQKRHSSTIDRENWKSFVRDSILEERELRRNWKERICRLSSLEFERGGGLCAVSVHGNFICSGYSSGAVVVWEGDAENVSSYRELISSDSVNSQRQRVHVTSTTINQKLCVAGFDNGDVCVWSHNLSSSPLYHFHCHESVKGVSLATSGPLAFVALSDHVLKVHTSDVNGRWSCKESRNYEEKIGHAMFIPNSASHSLPEHVAIATQDTVSILAPGRGLLSTMDHVIGGKLTCMDCTPDQLAIGVGSYGYGTLGNKVRLYILETSKMISVLGSHYREITCLDLASCPPHRLVTGSYDCRVRVFDLRSEKMALSFHLGHKRAVTAVQMDDWKVVSGAEDGTLVVWDQRMTSTLWTTHARHPVRLCKFQDSRMITANIPLDKTPRDNLWYADDLILHRRHRGVIRTFDFSGSNATEGIPEICSSNYDDTSGYNYNIKLSVPYDSIEM